MGYPTSVPALGSANTGDVVQAAHINDLRTEVTNLADGLLNGLQHALAISTGGLTVSTGAVIVGQSLSVAGGSTLASLDVAGNSTFHGPVTFSSAVTFAGTIIGLPLSPPRVRVGISTLVEIAADAWTGVSWTTEIYDSTGMHSTATQSSRLTCVGSTGVYHVGAVVDWNYSGGASSGAVKARILINDSTTASNVVTASMANGANEGVGFLALAGDALIASTSDYFTVQVFTRTSTRSLKPAGDAVTAFWAHQVST